MEKDFEWLKWVGLSIVISILVALYFVKDDKNKVIQTSQDAQLHDADQQYEEKLNQAAIAAYENQTAAEQEKQNPIVAVPITINQTKEYIEQIEQLRTTNMSINLDYLPDVAAQSRRYNSFVDQATVIYGDNDIANPYRYCTNVAWMARELWTITYSPTSAPKEYLDNSKKRFLESYEDAKKGCLEEVANPSS